MSFYKDIWFLCDCIDVSDVTNNNTNVGHIHWHHYTGDTLCSVLKMLQVRLQNLSGGKNITFTFWLPAGPNETTC